MTSVPASQIRYTVSDSAGTITNIVLGDVTGDSWIYGVGFSEIKEESGGDWNGEPITYDTYYLTIKYWDGSAESGK